MDPQENLSLNEYPSVHWEKFFKRFEEIDALPVKEWQTVHLLSYFSKRYSDHYGVKFSFKFNANSPSKSFEVFQMRKLSQIISSDPEILKDYIDWFFENKIILKKKRITSLAFVTDANSANEYKFKKLAVDGDQTVDRTTKLPPHVLLLANKFNVKCETYGDLAFIYKVASSADPLDSEFIMIDAIKQSGFNLSILNKVR